MPPRHSLHGTQILVTPDLQNGGGEWNLGTANWFVGTGYSVWDNATPASAVFGSGSGNGGTVTLGANIRVDDITFSSPNPPSSPGYTLAGGGFKLELVNTTIAGTATGTISATLDGSTGLSVTNTNSAINAGLTSGGILLTGTNTYQGTTTVGTGTSSNTIASLLRIGSVGALGNSTDIKVGSGSSLLIEVPNSVSTSVGSGKTVTIFGTGINNNGALRGADNAQNTWAGNVVIGASGARIGGGNGGTLTVNGVISEVTAGSGVIFNRNTNATTILNAVNTYTGDTTIFNNAVGSTATLKIGVDNAISSRSRLTALNTLATASEVLDLNGHILTLRGLETAGSTSAASSAQLIVKNDGGTASTLTVGDTTAANTATFGGSLRDGTGVLSLVKSGANTQVLVGANTYTGSTTVNSGTLQLGAATLATGAHFTGSQGTMKSTNFQLNAASFVIDNVGLTNNNNDRLVDTASFTLNSGTFTYKGSDQTTTNSTETVGNTTLNRGLSTISVQQGSTNNATLTLNQFNRAVGGGIALVNGKNLGQDSTATGVGKLLLTNAPTLVGTTNALPTGIDSTAKNTKIVPYLLGEAEVLSGGKGTATGVPNTFLTYNSQTGLRPLNPIDEFTSNSVVEGHNIRTISGQELTASTTLAINSLIIAGSQFNISQTVTNTSGAILFTTNNNVNGGTLNFANTEGLVTVNNGVVGIIGSKVTGTAGLSFFGQSTGTLGLGSSLNDYSGETTLHSGTVVPQVSSVQSGGVVTRGPFGVSTVVFAGSQIRAGSGATSPVTIDNALRFQADTTFVGGGGAGFNFTGPVTLTGGNRTLINNTTYNYTFSGVIGDGGQAVGFTLSGNGGTGTNAGTGMVTLSGNNTYTGPTTVSSTVLTSNSNTLNISGSIAGSSSVTVNNAATLILSGVQPDRIGDSAPLTLGNAGTGTTATLKLDNSAGPIQESLGSLTLGKDAVIDLGTGNMGSILRFAESQGTLWSGTLHIYNWTGNTALGGGTDQIFFGNSQGGLSLPQLAQIIFYSDAGTTPLGSGVQLVTGEVIPEPSTAMTLLAMGGGLLGWRRRRQA